MVCLVEKSEMFLAFKSLYMHARIFWSVLLINYLIDRSFSWKIIVIQLHNLLSYLVLRADSREASLSVMLVRNLNTSRRRSWKLETTPIILAVRCSRRKGEPLLSLWTLFALVILNYIFSFLARQRLWSSNAMNGRSHTLVFICV
jgi:hypothetical protein